MAAPLDAPVVAVTGASGFVGTWLVRYLNEQAERIGVRAVPFFDDRVSSDICNEDRVFRITAEMRPSAIVHLAAIAAPADAKRDQKRAWEVNVMGTLNIARAIMQNSPETRLVFTSSSEVYGDSFALDPLPLDETSRLLPSTPYGVTKASADMMLGQMARDGLKCVRFRPFNHTGPGQTEKYVISAFARQIACIEKGRQLPTISVGNLTAERDFVDVRDIVRAYSLAATLPDRLPPGMALNLASGIPRRLSTVLDMLIALSGKKVKVVADPAMIRPGDLPRIAGDATEAERILGWKAEIPFERTLEDVLQFWRDRV